MIANILSQELMQLSQTLVWNLIRSDAFVMIWAIILSIACIVFPLLTVLIVIFLDMPTMLIVPSRDAFETMRRYLSWKRRPPDTTSACFVVSKHYGQRYGFAKNMRLLRSHKSNVYPLLCTDSECRSDAMTVLGMAWFSDQNWGETCFLLSQISTHCYDFEQACCHSIPGQWCYSYSVASMKVTLFKRNLALRGSVFRNHMAISTQLLFC